MKLNNIKHYKKPFVKALYGRYGKKSGLNPGVMWPRKEELKYMKSYEEAFCPKLEDLLAEHNTKKEQAMKDRLAREKEIIEGLKRLPGEIKKFVHQMSETNK